MSYIQAEIKIPQFFKNITVNLYFPTDLPDNVGNKVKGVITLLHGLGNTGKDWFMMIAAARYAADNGYIIVAPNADNSFYIDMRYGSPYYTILTELLPAQLQAIFNIPTEREKNFLAGLSMGGYGAMRIGLSQPHKYAAVGSFSGVVDVSLFKEFTQKVPEMKVFMEPVLGPDLTIPPELNLGVLAEQVSRLPKQEQPRLFCSCGLQDNDMVQILKQNRAFHKTAAGLGLDIAYKEWDGVHEWNFWDRSLAEFIGFIQNSDYAERKRNDWNTESK